MAKYQGVKAVPTGGWSITGMMKPDTVTPNFHSWAPQDSNQVVCYKKRLQCITKENKDNSLLGFQLFREVQTRTVCKMGLIYQYQLSKNARQHTPENQQDKLFT